MQGYLNEDVCDGSLPSQLSARRSAWYPESHVKKFKSPASVRSNADAVLSRDITPPSTPCRNFWGLGDLFDTLSHWQSFGGCSVASSPVSSSGMRLDSTAVQEHDTHHKSCSESYEPERTFPGSDEIVSDQDSQWVEGAVRWYPEAESEGGIAVHQMLEAGCQGRDITIHSKDLNTDKVGGSLFVAGVRRRRQGRREECVRVQSPEENWLGQTLKACMHERCLGFDSGELMECQRFETKVQFGEKNEELQDAFLCLWGFGTAIQIWGCRE